MTHTSIFYTEKAPGKNELVDKFSVKGGPIIVEVLGYWEMIKGITFLKSMNRWDRRTNLKGATLTNCLSVAEFIRDKNGNIIGSKGYYPDKLSLIIDRLNLTVENVKAPWDMELLENGLWTGDMGFLQRKEVDVVSSGMGINLR